MMLPIRTQLNAILEEHHTAIGDWFQKQYEDIEPIFYSSVDLRHSGSKIAPVDTNLFPAGFNNLNEGGRKRAVAAAIRYLDRYYPEARTVLLLTESHTRNLMYLDNVAVLKSLLAETGRTLVLGSAEEGITEMRSLESASSALLEYQPLQIDNHILHTKTGIVPDLVINNNDLSTGIPPLLEGITQPVIPSVHLGWYRRRKSDHFACYDQVVRSFADHFPIDPFLISTLFHRCGKVHFKDRTGIECVALGVEKVLAMLRQKYEHYGISDEPYVFIKADNGTYGMGIMTARSGEEVMEMNKKLRNKMDVIKGGVENTEVIIQEGILTVDRIDGNVAEPMIYLVGGEPAGCIFRVNSERDAFGNLNAQGMHFEKNICEESNDTATPCKFGAFGLIARLASLAAAKEE
jgi:glutamate--cysteine ligase